MLVLRKLPPREPARHPLIPPLFTADDIRKHSMSHHDEIDRAPKRKEIRLDISVEGVVPGTIESTGLTAPAVEEHRAALRQVPALEIRELDVEIRVEEQVRRLDIAVKHASRVDEGDDLGGLSAPDQPLLA